MNSEKETNSIEENFLDFENPQKGDERSGKVVQKDENGIILSLGLKNDAWLPKDQIGDDLKNIKTGESLKVEIIRTNREKIIVSRKRICKNA